MGGRNHLIPTSCDVANHPTISQALAQLPKHVQGQARQTYKRFMQDPERPGLSFKRVHSTSPIYSIRVSLDYRALGVLDREDIIWFWIGSHADYQRVLAQS